MVLTSYALPLGDTVKPKFREKKATQIAVGLLTMRANNGTMSYLKLIKLMYLVERKSLLKWGRPLIFDSIVSMPKGLVLSQTLDLITSETFGDSYWKQHISAPHNYEVSLIGEEHEFDELSKAETDLIKEVFAEFGRMSRWDLVNFTHTLPEWTEPNGSSIPVEYKRVLEAGGKSEQDIIEIIRDLEETALFEHIISV
jgi:uncharacterized phage-associated protein